jgi:hypothetical protein
MYRKPGTAGVLKGVLSGPYAGARRVVDAAKLPRAARQRLADVLTGRTAPTPLLHEGPGGLGARFRATWGALVALIALATLTAIGFADPRAAWAYQPRALVAAYAAASMLFTFAVLALVRRRALVSGTALAPGRYLLPLDVVEVPAADRAGDQQLIVTPLGSARDARVRVMERKAELVIAFEGGSEVRFALRSEREGEHALHQLEYAQSLLEELTYARRLERALAHDAFFDVRVDDSWEAVSPSGPVSKQTKRRRAFLHGPLATASVLALGGALGGAALAGRNWASDRALYLRALRSGTLESVDAYLARGTAHRADAEVVRDRLEAQRAELAQRSAESKRSAAMRGFEGSPRAEWELTPEEARLRAGLADTCEGLLRARAAPSHPEITGMMEGFVRRGRATGDALIPVRVDLRLGSRPAAVPESDEASLAATTVSAFERIFSQVCPASLVRFAIVKPRSMARSTEGAGAEALAPGLDVKVDVTWPKAPTWTFAADPDTYACGPPRDGRGRALPCPEGGRVAVHAPTYVFEVALRPLGAAPQGERSDGARPASFRLTLPPPAQAPTGVRARSLFEVPPSALPAGTYDPSVYTLLAARAFDRLYDELYGLFLRGDPEVPLRP